jgi:hypothetical protein
VVPLADRVRKPFESYLATNAELRAALITGARKDAAPLEHAARRARAVLGTGEARELLDEAVSAGDVEPASHAALLAHLVDIAEAEVLSRRSLLLERVGDEPVVVDGRERTTAALVRELRQHGRKDERSTLRGLEEHFANDREARREALAESEERGARILARGPRDADEAPDTTRELCARFLASTDDAAGELSERARHPAGAEGRGLLGLLRALSPESLDPLVATKGRPRRLGAVFGALGLAKELGRSVAHRPSRLLTIAPSIVRIGSRVTLFTSTIELGLASERAFFAALGEALTLAMASPAAFLEHRHAPLGSAASAIGLLFGDALSEAALTTPLYSAGTRADRHLRTCASALTLLDARVACARALVTERTARGEVEARDRVAAALGCDPGEVPLELALPLRQSQRRDLVDARARLVALALVPALRERYDTDFHRNPRFGDFVRGAAARGGLVSAEALVVDAGGTMDAALIRASELASR